MTDSLREAVNVLLNGGVVAYPTEAVFGLGCDPMSESAVDRLLTLKGRPRSKGLILIAADYTQLRRFIGPLETSRLERILQSWPGPFTWVVPAADSVPEWVRGDHESLAVRVTAHPIAAELCRTAGIAIVSTSANISGHRPARSAQEVREQFGDSIDFVLDGELGALSSPTQIRDAVTGTVLRAGS